MSSWKEKIQSSKKKIQKSIHSKSFWKHFFLMAVIVLASGIVLSMIPAKVTTINDMAIRYTEPQTEELETEGFAEETEAEQSQDRTAGFHSGCSCGGGNCDRTGSGGNYWYGIHTGSPGKTADAQHQPPSMDII